MLPVDYLRSAWRIIIVYLTMVMAYVSFESDVCIASQPVQRNVGEVVANVITCNICLPH